MKKLIQIYSLSLGYGGIEREVITLANSLVSLYNVELVFLNKYVTKEVNINKKVNVTILNIDSINIFTSKVLKDFISHSKADAIISTSYEFNKYLAKSNSNKIFWEHNHHDNTSIDFDNVKKALNGFNKVVVPNEVLYDLYSNVFDNVYLIPNIIDCEENISADYNSDNIVYVGKLESHKGVTDLIDVFFEVHKKYSSAKLYIIGDGSLRIEMEKKVRSYNISSNVLFMGSLNKHEINDIMSKSSIFVSCSKSESFGISVVEAMNNGLACVVFDDVYSFTKLIDHEINGYLIRNRSKADMINTISLLLDKKNETRNIGLCAKEKASLYDVNKLKNEWIKII